MAHLRETSYRTELVEGDYDARSRGITEEPVWSCQIQRRVVSKKTHVVLEMGYRGTLGIGKIKNAGHPSKLLPMGHSPERARSRSTERKGYTGS